MSEFVVVAGSRGFNDYGLMSAFLDSLDLSENDTIISGTAWGADTLGERYAREHGLRIIRMPADWERFGKRAGYLRNEKMARAATRVVVFWDGESRGSKHMIDIARRMEVTLNVVYY